MDKTIEITGATTAELYALLEALHFTNTFDEDHRSDDGTDFEDSDPDRLIPKWIKVVDELYKKQKEENYDGPGDGEAWSGGFAKNH